MLIFVTPGTLEQDNVTDTLWTAGATGLEERAGMLRAYFNERAEVPLAGEWVDEQERDWQAEWKKDLKPVQAGHFTIAPSWLRAEVPPAQRPILIDPGMAFGTGHHATTRLAVEAISELQLQGKDVLDVGTGSGILALAALLQGAAQVLGVDIDPVTIPAAYENALLNGLQRTGNTLKWEGRTLQFIESSLDDDHEGEYDLLIANLYAELHDLLAGNYRAIMRPGAQLILTGILQDKLPLVQSALAREGFEDVRTRQEGEWLLVMAHTPREV